MPQVSVIMPVYDREKYVGAAIDSILEQTFTNFELIIVDDGSTDGTAEIARRYADRDKRIKHVRLPTNKGEANARNVGIGQARGDFITSMDSDDISLPGRLQQQVEFLQTHAEVDAVGVGTRMVNEDLSPKLDYKLSPHHGIIVLQMLIGGAAVLQGTLMARRAPIMKSAGYDTRFLNGTDFEYFLRMVWEQQIRFANLLTPLYIYRRHEASLTHTHTWPSTASVEARRRALELLWGRAPAGTLERFTDVHFGEKLARSERRAAKRDLMRLIDAMIAADWVDAGERGLMLAEMNRRLEGTLPRRWLLLLHWYRHRIQRHLV